MKIDLPLEVYYTKNKKFILNLNNYRNAHYRILSNAKKIYADNLVDRISYPTYKEPVVLTYTYYAKSKRRLDVSNPCLLYTSPSPRDGLLSRMPSSA